MIDVIEGIRQSSRLFNEPKPSQSCTAILVACELDEIVEMLAELQRHNERELRRIENRVVLIRERLARLPEVGV